MAGLGTFATFTSTVTPTNPQVIASGKVELQITGTTTLDVGATNIVPGDTLQRVVDLKNNSPRNLATLILTAASTGLPPDDPTRVMTLDVDRCDALTGWTEDDNDPYQYSCTGTETAVLDDETLIGDNDLSALGLSAMTAGETDHLRFTLTFPASAGDNFQQQTSTVSYSFTGLQAAGTDR
jgi:hypothetical protein